MKNPVTALRKKRRDNRKPKIRRVITANIKQDLPLDRARASLAAVMNRKPDLVALQEWHHPDLLAAYDAEYEWTEQPIMPIGIRRCVGGFRSTRLIRMSKEMPGVRATYGLDAEIREHATGKRHAVLNVHPVAHLDRPRNHEAWRQSRARIDVWIGDNRAQHHRWVLGDMNMHNVQMPPLISCWKGRSLQATIGRRTIDGVWSEFRARWVRLRRTFSDHKAVEANYSGRRK